MRHRTAIGVVVGLCLCALPAPAQDAPGVKEPTDGELRRMLVDPPDARPGFPRDDKSVFAPQEPKGLPQHFDASGPAQKLLLRDVDPSKMDYTRDGRFFVRSRNDVRRDWYEYLNDLSLLGRFVLRESRKEGPITIVWLFDESRSMQDDRDDAFREMKRALQQVRDLEDRLQREPDKAGAIRKGEAHGAFLPSHLVGGFGQSLHFVTPVPVRTAAEAIDACDRLTTDESGIENSFHAMTSAVREAQRLVRSGTRVMLVLFTDESGNDEEFLEDTVQVLKSANVQVYVVGREALFSKTQMRLGLVVRQADEHAQPMIRRGPESADFEALLWDGLHEREDEQPAGCEPYALARVVKETGGRYFWLPSLELQRSIPRQGAGYVVAVAEYAPELVAREEYVARRERSPLRRTLYETIQATRDFAVPLRFPYEPRPLAESLADATGKAERQRLELISIEGKLRALRDERGREPSKRWQANYDLMLAQIVAFQVTLREYQAAVYDLQSTVKDGVPVAPTTWAITHGRERRAPRKSTEAGYLEAERLLKQVIAHHPDTPWAALAETIHDRGFGVGFWQKGSAAAPRPVIDRVNY